MYARLGYLLSVCRYAQLLGRNRPMAAQSYSHVYMEMLETGTHVLQKPTGIWYRQVAGMAMG